MDELENIQKLLAGNEEAFRELVKNYQKMVVNTCFGMVHNQEDAEDIAQEVFIEVYRSIHKFRSDSKLSTWVYRIAVNKSLNYIRDNKKNKWFQNLEDVFSVEKSNGLIADNTGQPEYNIEKSQRAEMLHQVLSSLPEKQKTAFSLNKSEDLSYQEISEVMELSLSSVESLIHRAKKNLQKKLYSCYKKKCI